MPETDSRAATAAIDASMVGPALRARPIVLRYANWALWPMPGSRYPVPDAST